MRTTFWFLPDMRYLRSLIGAGVDGISQARREARDAVFTPPLHSIAWKSMAAGAAAGLLGAGLSGDRKRARLMAGGALGTAVGLGAAVAWASRQFTISAGRSALQSVNDARDAHWLRANPIDYA